MSNLTLTVEPSVGSDLLEICAEAIELASKLGVVIKFEFNGVTCLAASGDFYEDLANNCKKSMEAGNNIRIATAEQFL